MRWIHGVAVIVGSACSSGGGSSPGSDAPVQGGAWSVVSNGVSYSCGIRGDGSLSCWGDNRAGQLGIGSAVEADEPTQVGSSTWTAIDTGDYLTCGIQTDQSLWCWGEVGMGLYIGDGTYYGAAMPVKIGDGWMAVSVGYSHACGLHTDGTLWCWGSTDANLGVGDGTTIFPATPVQIGTDQWKVVSVGHVHTCAIHSSGTLWCWGSNFGGQLGDGTTNEEIKPAMVSSATWAHISAGNNFTCGVTADGAASCWGFDTFGQLGHGPAAMGANPDPTPVMIGGATVMDWKSVIAGDTDACGVRSDGSLWCWGNNRRDQLGQDGPTELVDPTMQSGGAARWQSVAVGLGHVCAVGADHSLWCIGSDSHGELGDGGSSHRTPTRIAGTWTDVSLGWELTCALDASGRPLCAGRGVGDGTPNDRRTPVAVTATGLPWKQVSAGNAQGCGIASDSSLWCWWLAAPDRSMSLVPMMMSTGAWTSVSVDDHACAIDTNAGMSCWGDDQYGEDASPLFYVASPTSVGSGMTWLAAATGGYHTCALASTGIACFGGNFWGQLGLGLIDATGDTHATPTFQSGGPTFVSISAGYGYTCGLTAAGAAYCWGYGKDGELGANNMTTVATPTAIPGLMWRLISAGQEHACGIATDGSLYCWGFNERGQLGDGTQDSKGTPTRIGTDTDWSEVSAGGFHSCATKSDHSLWCWGANDEGELGDGMGWREQMILVP